MASDLQAKQKTPLSQVFGFFAAIFKPADPSSRLSQTIVSCIDPLDIFQGAARKEQERNRELHARIYGEPLLPTKKYIKY